jgi:hypothetical protein
MTKSEGPVPQFEDEKIDVTMDDDAWERYSVSEIQQEFARLLREEMMLIQDIKDISKEHAVKLLHAKIQTFHYPHDVTIIPLQNEKGDWSFLVDTQMPIGDYPIKFTLPK